MVMLNPASNAALNIALSSIERRTDRAWSYAERDMAVGMLLATEPFTMPQAATGSD